MKRFLRLTPDEEKMMCCLVNSLIPGQYSNSFFWRAHSSIAATKATEPARDTHTTSLNTPCLSRQRALMPRFMPKTLNTLEYIVTPNVTMISSSRYCKARRSGVQ